MRGLDYYNDTVFEWVNEDFGAQSTVCGGGRYDGLVAQLGGQATAAFGFGMGLERLIQILQEQGAEAAEQNDDVDLFIVSVGASARRQALVLQRDLIQAGLSVNCHQGAGSMKNQFKRADKSGAKLAVIISEQEAQDNTASVKPLRRPQTPIEQQTIAQNDVVNVVTNLLESL